MATDYAEQLLQAMEIVMGKCLTEIAFDKTEKCTIIDDSDKKNGRYTVTNGSTRFDAFVKYPDAEYKINDSVRVSIPNGDFSQKKYIDGLNVEDNDTHPITYVSPLDTMLDMTDNIIDGEITHGLRANDKSQSEYCLWTANCTQANYRHLQNNGIYDTIAIKADFKTLLTGYNVNSGSYGLRLDMDFKPTNGTDKLIRHSAYLDSSSFFGNPYSFLIYSTQAVKFSVANIGTIQTLSLWFYQKNNFTYLTDDKKQYPLPILNANDPDYSNILLKNVYLSFGSDIADIDDNTVKLYTNEPFEYDVNPENQSYNTKGIGLLWYNKNDAGQYLGFSDGIATPPPGKKYYDEIEYLIATETDSRLLAQQGKDIPGDEAGLDLSADIVEAEQILNKLNTSISQDLFQMLHNYTARIEGIYHRENNIKTKIEKLVDSKTDADSTSAAKVSKVLTQDTEDLVNYYIANLADAKKKLEGEEYTPTTLEAKTPAEIVKLANNFIADINNLLSTATDIIDRNYVGFKSVQDTFERKFAKLIGITQSYIDSFVDLMDGNETKLNAFFKSNYNYVLYKSDIKPEDYANRYCIYWYRREPNLPLDPSERFMEKGWRRLTTAADFNYESNDTETLIHNFGLPQQTQTIDGVTYYNKRTDVASQEGVLKRLMDGSFAQEEYKVIVFYNHEMYKSESLVFTNINPPQDESASDQTGALYIEHGANSRDSYQAYGVNNCLVNAADAYIVRNLSVHYDGLLGKDEQLIDSQVFWYIPENATMLTYDLNDYGTEFTHDKYDKPDVNAPTKMDGYICFYRKIEADKNGDLITDRLNFSYHIKDYYVHSSSNNTIICKVIMKDGRELETSIMLNFSSYGTSGTDYTLTIAPAGFQSAITEDNMPQENSEEVNYLDFKITLYDYNSQEINLPLSAVQNHLDQRDGPKFLGPSMVPYDAIWKVDDEEKEDPSVVGCRIWIPTEEGGPQNQFYFGVISVTATITIEEQKDDEGKIIQKGRTVDLTSFATIPYTDRASIYQGQVFIEGPSIVVYDSTGGSPTYYKNPFKIFSKHPDFNPQKEIENVSWVIMHYDENGILINEADLKDEEDIHKYSLLFNYVPKLEGKQLIPSNMYLDSQESTGLESALYSVVCCIDNDSIGEEKPLVLWAQPIYLLKNRYASAMLNAWDGALKIDEENGTIMSSMVGAGYKTAQNTFEGVLMGDVGGQVGADNATGVGLYGYNNGAQSFHFGVDGTAFIGKSGRGRILFDGTSGTISSASYQQNRSWNEETKTYGPADAGMMIDLDDGFIDIFGASKITETTYERDGYRSHIRIDAQSPYFFIHSANQESDNKYIFYVGTDDYYLESDNYVPGKYSQVDGISVDNEGYLINKSGQYVNEYGTVVSESQKVYGRGAGTHFNLQDGRLDAYNLLLTSKNVFIDSTDMADPYFIIKDDDGCNLMYVGQTDFYIQSHTYSRRQAGDIAGTSNNVNYYYPGMKINTNGNDFLFDVQGQYQSLIKISDTEFYLQSDTYVSKANSSTGYGQGTKINLHSGAIDAYNFIIRGESSTNPYAGSYLLLDSANSELAVHLKLQDSDGTVDLDLLRVSPTSWLMQSANWQQVTNSTTSVTRATVTNGTYNVRNKPSMNGTVVSWVHNGESYTIYEISGDWWRISTGQEWVYGEAFGWSSYQEGASTTSGGSGAQIDLMEGTFIFQSDVKDDMYLKIDSGDSNYPLVIGRVSNPAFKVGWDGALYGGTTYKWSILEDGTATFKKMNANSGSLGYMYLSNCTIATGTIGGMTLSGGSLTAGNCVLSSAGITIDGVILSKGTLKYALVGGGYGISCTVYGPDGTSIGSVFVPVANYTSTVLGLTNANA